MAHAGLVRSLHRAFNERERDAFLDCLAEDVVWHVAGRHPLAGRYEGCVSLWDGFMGPMWASPARVEDRELLEHGDHVVAIGDAVHDFGQGQRRFATVEVLRLEGDHVAERWEFTSNQPELDRLLTRGCEAAAGQRSD
jgi:ketosteroid isomerase-like protein